MEKQLFKDLVRSLKQARAIARGKAKPSRVFRVDAPHVRAIRERTRLSQAEFARLLGVSVRTLQNWEQARRRPTGPAAALLKVVAREPEAAVRALHS